MRGAFITLEGTEGVGKSTQVSVLERLLRASGFDVLVTREPGGTPLGEKVRDWVLDRETGRLSAQVEVLLMFAARAQHLEQLIRPALARGQWVICDRFTDATMAYQGAGRGGDLAFIETIARAVHPDLEPDLTLLFDAPIEVGLARIAARPVDRFEQEQREFFERVRNEYLKLAARQPERIKLIDASRTTAEVGANVEQALMDFLERRA